MKYQNPLIWIVTYLRMVNPKHDEYSEGLIENWTEITFGCKISFSHKSNDLWLSDLISTFRSYKSQTKTATFIHSFPYIIGLNSQFLIDPFQHFGSDMQKSLEQINFINHKTLNSKVSPPSIYTSTKILRRDRDHLMLDSKQKDLCFYPLLLLYYKLSISSPPLALWAGKLGFVMHSDPKIETNVWLNWVLHIGIQFYLQFLLLFGII